MRNIDGQRVDAHEALRGGRSVGRERGRILSLKLRDVGMNGVRDSGAPRWRYRASELRAKAATGKSGYPPDLRGVKLASD